MANLLRLGACLLLCFSLNSFGAYYIKTDGTIVDPIPFFPAGPFRPLPPGPCPDSALTSLCRP